MKHLKKFKMFENYRETVSLSITEVQTELRENLNEFTGNIAIVVANEKIEELKNYLHENISQNILNRYQIYTIDEVKNDSELLNIIMESKNIIVLGETELSPILTNKLKSFSVDGF